MKLLLQTRWQTVASLHIQQVLSNICIQTECLSGATDECKSDIYSSSVWTYLWVLSWPFPVWHSRTLEISTHYFVLSLVILLHRLSVMFGLATKRTWLGLRKDRWCLFRFRHQKNMVDYRKDWWCLVWAITYLGSWYRSVPPLRTRPWAWHLWPKLMLMAS